MKFRKDNVVYRVEQDLKYFNHEMPRENVIAWRAYFAGLLDWEVIDLQTYDLLCSMIPEIDNDPVISIMVGRKESGDG